MAAVVSGATSKAASGFGVQQYVSDAFDVSVGDVLKVFVSISSFALTAGAITISSTATVDAWSEPLTSILISGNAQRASFFYARVTSAASARTVTIDIAGVNNNSIQLQVVRVTGLTSTGYHVQSSSNSTTGNSPNSLTVTLSSGITANNPVVAGFCVGSDSAQTAGGSYTEVYDDSSLTGSEANSLMTCYQAPGTTTPSSSGTPDFADMAGFAMEGNEDTGGAVSTFRFMTLLGAGA